MQNDKDYSLQIELKKKLPSQRLHTMILYLISLVEYERIYLNACMLCEYCELFYFTAEFIFLIVAQISRPDCL